jgi:hypothetical protein
VSRYLQYQGEQYAIQKTVTEPKAPSAARVESWRQWNETRLRRRHLAMRERDADLSRRILQWWGSVGAESRQRNWAMDDLVQCLPGHSRVRIGAALKAAGWVTEQRRGAGGRHMVWTPPRAI